MNTLDTQNERCTSRSTAETSVAPTLSGLCVQGPTLPVQRTPPCSPTALCVGTRHAIALPSPAMAKRAQRAFGAANGGLAGRNTQNEARQVLTGFNSGFE